MIVYGVKGMAAYAEHAKNIGKENMEINAFIYEALEATLDDSLTADDLVALTLKTGEYGVKVMALLDEANTSMFGNPEITEVNIGVRKNPAILISGHDLTDLKQLLEQTKGTGVDVYTPVRCCPPIIIRLSKSMTILSATTATHGGSNSVNLNPFMVRFCLPQTASYRRKAKRSETESLPRVPPAT
jgi:hydroxylamine reductase (hybrid-cluster protein)